MEVYTHQGWLKEGRTRFGDDIEKWKFVCPVCGHKQTIRDFKKQGILYGFAHVYFLCISCFAATGACGFSCANKITIFNGWRLPLVRVQHRAELITRKRIVPVFQFGVAEQKTGAETAKPVASHKAFFGREPAWRKQRSLFQSEALTATVVPNLLGGWSIKDGRGTEFGNYSTKVDAERIMAINGW